MSQLLISALRRIAGGSIPYASNFVQEANWRGFVNALQQEAANALLEAIPASPHDLYKTGDADAPDVIRDRNGEVVLGLCRRCGQGEADLEEMCPGPRVDTGNLADDPLYKALDALYHRGWNDSGRNKHDARGAQEWQNVLDLFRTYRAPVKGSALTPEAEETVTERLLSAYSEVCRVSGSALLAGERKAQTPDQRGRVYRSACLGHSQIGDVILKLAGRYPRLDEQGNAFLEPR